MTGIRVVFSTTKTVASAEALAQALVRERLAACVNILPHATSVYRWEDKIESASECLLIIKTRSDNVSELIGRIQELHPYDVPEIVVLEVSAGFPPYLSWVLGETAKE